MVGGRIASQVRDAEAGREQGYANRGNSGIFCDHTRLNKHTSCRGELRNPFHIEPVAAFTRVAASSGIVRGMRAVRIWVVALGVLGCDPDAKLCHERMTMSKGGAVPSVPAAAGAANATEMHAIRQAVRGVALALDCL